MGAKVAENARLAAYHRPVDAHELSHADRGDLEWLRGMAAAMGVGGNRPQMHVSSLGRTSRWRSTTPRRLKYATFNARLRGVAGLLFVTVSVNVRWKSWAVGYANAHFSLH